MTTLTVDVRRAQASDASAISAVHRTAWTQAYGGLIPHQALSRMLERRGETWWRKATRGASTLLVVEVGSKVVGYATLGLNRARGLAQDGEIYELYILPEYQGAGLGKLLFSQARAVLKSLGLDGLVVWCLEDCDLACQFLQAHGGRDMVEGIEDFDQIKLKKIGYIWPK
jgi:GNAT superfamily N-acetyltransferase